MEWLEYAVAADSTKKGLRSHSMWLRPVSRAGMPPDYPIQPHTELLCSRFLNKLARSFTHP